MTQKDYQNIIAEAEEQLKSRNKLESRNNLESRNKLRNHLTYSDGTEIPNNYTGKITVEIPRNEVIKTWKKILLSPAFLLISVLIIAMFVFFRTGWKEKEQDAYRVQNIEVKKEQLKKIVSTSRNENKAYVGNAIFNKSTMKTQVITHRGVPSAKRPLAAVKPPKPKIEEEKLEKINRRKLENQDLPTEIAEIEEKIETNHTKKPVNNNELNYAPGHVDFHPIQALPAGVGSPEKLKKRNEGRDNITIN
ncbi:MAG: hypothetical protein ACLFQV_14100 [Vulcanimicrobiota bacterium]